MPGRKVSTGFLRVTNVSSDTVCFMRKILIGVAAFTIFLSGCTAEPIVLVVPEEASELTSGADLMVDKRNFVDDVIVLREGIAPGQFLDGVANWYYAEVKNESQNAVYQFEVVVDFYDSEGKVRAANLKSPLISINPGETVLFFERAGRTVFPTEPESVVSTFLAQSARQVTEADLTGLTLENVDFGIGSAGFFGGRDYAVSGEVKNAGTEPVSAFRVDSWCEDSSGAFFVMPSNAFGGGGVLQPGSSVPYLSDMFSEATFTVDSCKSTVVKAELKEYGPGVDVSPLRDVDEPSTTDEG